MSQPITQFPNVCVIDTSLNNDTVIKSKAIAINDKLSIETRIIPKDLQFEDKNLQSLLKKTDIVTDKYEGGLKIWECSIDLSQCIMDSFSKSDTLLKFIEYICSSDIINVLELGCGHSLPSITFVSIINALQYNEEKTDKSCKVMLCLQDLNKDVLVHVSIPNIWLNCKQSIKTFNVISGDWRDIKLIDNLLRITQNKHNQHQKYDVIFGSETIYNESMIETLFNLLMNLLSKPNGICFISAKAYYFGIGGGTQTLKLLMNNNNKYPFDIHTIQRIDDGMSNLRETIILTWKDQRQWDLKDIWQNINDFESEEEEDIGEEEEYQNDEEEL